jgi:N-acetylglucosaminyl-diphospho-decaprenol L-rhamnosyltransferase|tara:strand:- start:305 stop:1153 length:849 start_codon:yes stop_codon:yes gene_type:complete
MALKNITIVITAFKSDKKIRTCLNSIDKDVKVIIVENSNNYKFKEEIERIYANVECIISGENLGYARANNIGLKKVSTKYALVLNPDTILAKDALDNFFQSISNYSDFTLLGPLPSQEKELLKKYQFNNSEFIKVPDLKGFAIFFNMEKFKDKIFFDENYFLYFEEIDLCKTVNLHGGKIYINKNINIFHEGGKSVDSKFELEIEKSRNWHWMWSTFYYHKKYKNYFLALAIVMPKLISSILKIIFYLIMQNKRQRIMYYQRFSGLFNSILGRKSWYRLSLD